MAAVLFTSWAEALPAFMALVFAGLACSGKLSVTAARVLFFLSWAIGLYGLRLYFGWTLALLPVSLLLTVFLAALAIWVQPEAVPKYFGRLRAKRQILLSPYKKTTPRLEIGDSGAIFEWAGEAEKPQFVFFRTSNLIVERVRGRIVVSTSVTDMSGNVIAELVRNAWRAPPPHAWDRNYSQDAVEIKGAHGRIVLQVRVLPDRIQIQGEWWGPTNGLRMVAAPDQSGALFLPFGPPKYRSPGEGFQIKPLFRYPSELNLGKLATE